MINMTHRPHIHMRLRALKLRLAHGCVCFSKRAVDLVAAIGDRTDRPLPGLSAGCSDRLSYAAQGTLWESNPRHQPYHGCALPTELEGRGAPNGREPRTSIAGSWPRRSGVVSAPVPSPAVTGLRIRLAEQPDAGGDPGHLQPRGHDGDQHVRPGPPVARRPGGVAGGPHRRLLGDRRPRRRRGRGVRLALAVQGAGGLRHDGRGLGVRRPWIAPGQGIGTALLGHLLEALRRRPASMP